MNDGSTEGATAGEDLSGLRRAHLADKRLRDATELELISRAYDKHVFRARPKKEGWLTEGYVRSVHRDMFGGLWDWAGKYRATDVNIGMNWTAIPEQVRLLCDDFAHWNASGMDDLETAARLQGRLTRIHPFKNGNGRHARLLTDVFFHSRRRATPRWPQLQLLPHGDDVRRRYIVAMKLADAEDYSALISFIKECLHGPSR